MSTRFTWLLGILILLSIGLLVACGSHFSASSDGLLLVPSQDSQVIQTFSFNLTNGKVSTINNPPATNGKGSSVVLDPTGAFAYVLVDQNTIATYKVNSNGTLSPVGKQHFAKASIPIPGVPTPDSVAVVPAALAMASSGKFLFSANRQTTDSAGRSIPGSVSVFSVGGNAALSEVSGSPFFAFAPVPGAAAQTDFTALAVTPTTFPVANAVCSGAAQPPPKAQYLYVTDALNNEVWEFAVASSGALGNPPSHTSAFAADSVPSGVAVDPCGRFVYVANLNAGNISAYTICTAVTSTCAQSDGSLTPVSGSPFSAGNGPGPIATDAFGNFLYVVDTLANTISDYKIGQSSGALTPLAPATVATGTTPVSIAIRSDDSWMFVANYGSATVSQYAITPATGVLNPAGTGITTDNFPWGVAVK